MLGLVMDNALSKREQRVAEGDTDLTGGDEG